ncbi:hydroxymethylglutaryl-CoA synthase [Monocercomonoides exilis]|uniref:hydroxymethylglutaryl-CoA synthase n=1 Tax=Monocercomonoides exilis TaxID=2049356 RepID=UPI00355A5872|nr:hydroxymethylglutaryl-CoA synthase [Monocercomonoides exilis]|eukprot:MONOS_71.1-p1 / transcript=MONOS_71.1 / gene=MONOS_71 / organism=Monocercomonoides_exilis_PA203 / gene_product=hydroxymethylglutaryl-CoA synthase [EC:2.3.3.10] / transcript_product=hydroxymethylglutaryl-CoA synthase [EC:2.3.3.10] / location=Mono_scaffold00001:363595-365427(-) / protein_length=475 / sequence_SO=supercontig / SO=protein_coding / is_pseudo=false
MRLFDGNPNIRGLDSTNACFGGTETLFNAVDHVTIHGGYAIAVATDVALYGGPSESAQPTGGAGAAAMLITPNAPLVIERLRSFACDDEFDFWKPDSSHEYPVVNGPLSLNCYLRGLDLCFENMQQKTQELRMHCKKIGEKEPPPFSLSQFSHFLFHSPYHGMVKKAYSRLLFLERHSQIQLQTQSGHSIDSGMPFSKELKWDEFSCCDGMSLSDTLKSNEYKVASRAVLKRKDAEFEEKVMPSAFLPKKTGNSYTASVFFALASLLHKQMEIENSLTKLREDASKESRTSDDDEKELELEKRMMKRVLCYSYGSGFVSALWTIRVNEKAGLSGKPSISTSESASHCSVNTDLPSSSSSSSSVQPSTPSLSYYIDSFPECNHSFTIHSLLQSMAHIDELLANRKEMELADFKAAVASREKYYNKAGWSTTSQDANVANVCFEPNWNKYFSKGVFYLKEITDDRRRIYEEYDGSE